VLILSIDTALPWWIRRRAGRLTRTRARAEGA
jgi:hypothetical protein